MFPDTTMQTDLEGLSDSWPGGARYTPKAGGSKPSESTAIASAITGASIATAESTAEIVVTIVAVRRGQSEIEPRTETALVSASEAVNVALTEVVRMIHFNGHGFMPCDLERRIQRQH